MHGKRSKALLKKFEHDGHITNFIKWIRRNRPTVYTTVHTFTKFGLSYTMTVYVIRDGKIVNLNWFIEKLTGYKRNKDGELIVYGFGTDMGFGVVYVLSKTLFPDGFSPVDKDGGYALNQERI